MGSFHMPCWSPLTSRNYFKKGVEGFIEDWNKTLLSDAFSAIISSGGYKLIFSGDSIMTQLLNALECRLARENGGITGENLHSHQTDISRGDISLQKLSSGLPYVFTKLGLHGKSKYKPTPYWHLENEVSKWNSKNISVIIVANMGMW